MKRRQQNTRSDLKSFFGEDILDVFLLNQNEQRYLSPEDI